MSETNLQQLLLEIRRQCQHIVDATNRFGEDDFKNDLFIRGGFERVLLNVGEAAVHLRDEFPREFELVPGLRNAIGLRNRLAHGYETAIDTDIEWTVISESIPQMIKDIDKLAG